MFPRTELTGVSIINCKRQRSGIWIMNGDAIVAQWGVWIGGRPHDMMVLGRHILWPYSSRGCDTVPARDTQTDGQTDVPTLANTGLCIASSADSLQISVRAWMMHWCDFNRPTSSKKN